MANELPKDDWTELAIRWAQMLVDNVDSNLYKRDRLPLLAEARQELFSTAVQSIRHTMSETARLHHVVKVDISTAIIPIQQHPTDEPPSPL